MIVKIYIKDGIVCFYKYKITGTDNLSRPVTLYAKDDKDKTKQIARIHDGLAVDISPSMEVIEKAKQWQLLNQSNNFNVADVENYINLYN